jgi:hypothetical protein
MIISYSNNFCLVCPPKTGSTSSIFYLLRSGLVDLDKDIFRVEDLKKQLGFLFQDEVEKEAVKKVSADFMLKSSNDLKLHTEFDVLKKKYLLPEGMDCVGTIRNPLNRLASAFYMLKKHRAVLPTIMYNALQDPNTFFDAVQESKENSIRLGLIKKPQVKFFPNHAKLFNTENLHQHINRFIEERKGLKGAELLLRKNPDNKLDVFLTELTPDRKQDILDTYAKDFELWEKAYAVYN